MEYMELREARMAIERWLRDEAVPSYERDLNSPETGVPIDDILPRIKARYAASKGA